MSSIEMRKLEGPVVGIILLFLLSPMNAQEKPAYLNVNRITGSAVDAKGVRHRAQDYRGNHPPWMDDRLKTIAPSYPYADRRLHHEGVGLVRLMLDLRTGRVNNVVVVKSTGFKTLDESAVAAFRQWQWKSGKWKEIEMRVNFTMTTGALPLAPGAVRLPRG